MPTLGTILVSIPNMDTKRVKVKCQCEEHSNSSQGLLAQKTELLQVVAEEGKTKTKKRTKC